MKTRISALLVALGLATAASVADAATIYAAWDLNEGSGSTTTQWQLSGGEYWNQVSNPNATLSATASAALSTANASWGDASDAPGSTASLLFNGNTTVNVLDSNVSGTGLGGTGAKTFLAWVNATSTTDGILSYSPRGGSTPNGADLRLVINASGRVRGEVTGGFFEASDDDGLLQNQGWTMVAAVFDTDTNSSSLFLGGFGFLANYTRSANLAINTGTTAGVGGSFLDFVIGGDQAGRGFNGGIDMVAVYNGSLSASELNNIYTNGIVVVPEPSAAALLATLPLWLLRRRYRARA